MYAAAVFAQEVTDKAGAVTVDDLWLNFAIGAIIPLLVGLVTRLDASSGLKAVINFFFSAVVSVGQQLIQGDALTSKELFIKVMTTWITSIMAYEGFQKPTGIAGKVANIAPQLGIGQPDLTTDEVGLEELTEESLWNQTTKELQEIAKGMGIKGRSKLDKGQLIDAILKAKA